MAADTLAHQQSRYWLYVIKHLFKMGLKILSVSVFIHTDKNIQHMLGS